MKVSNGSNDLSEHVSIEPKWEGVKQLLEILSQNRCVVCNVGMYHLKLHSAIHL